MRLLQSNLSDACLFSRIGEHFGNAHLHVPRWWTGCADFLFAQIREHRVKDLWSTPKRSQFVSHIQPRLRTAHFRVFTTTGFSFVAIREINHTHKTLQQRSCNPSHFVLSLTTRPIQSFANNCCHGQRHHFGFVVG